MYIVGMLCWVVVNKTLCCRWPGPNRHLDEGWAKGEYPEPCLPPHQKLMLPVHQDHQFLLLPPAPPQMIGENDPGAEQWEHQDIGEPQPMQVPPALRIARKNAATRMTGASAMPQGYYHPSDKQKKFRWKPGTRSLREI